LLLALGIAEPAPFTRVETVIKKRRILRENGR
jgi:hypothetical protein